MRKTLLKILMTIAACAMVVGSVGGIYVKSRAIEAMHKADCQVDCVAFGALSDRPVNIPRWIAWGYYLCMAGVWGGGMILILPEVVRRRRR